MPHLFFDRNGSTWKILYQEAVVYSITVVQKGGEFWLEYTDSKLREMGSDEQYQCIAVNTDKLPAVLKLILGVDIRSTSSPG